MVYIYSEKHNNNSRYDPLYQSFTTTGSVSVEKPPWSPCRWDIVVCDLTTQTALRSLTPPIISFSRVKSLLNTCAEQHADCSLPRQDHVVPFLRVIDCTTREVVDAPTNCEYVALSYVWGSIQSVNTDLASMPILPPVIEQSIIVTSKLGFKFLWIDRYVSHPTRFLLVLTSLSASTKEMSSTRITRF